METILEKIVADKRLWVAQRKQKQPLDTFISQVIPSDRSFFSALNEPQTAFIMECKKASPSKGLIRADFDLTEIATTYAPYASVVSVLCDEKYFQGHYDFLSTVRAIVPCPVLCKDFMIDPYQIYLARFYGADAILLMLSVLNDDEYQKMAQIAQKLHLGILTETSNQEEMDRAIKLGAKVMGVNNRNLRDLSIDLNRTRTLAPQIPKEAIAISESGIYTHDQVKSLAPLVNGFLIGSSLMGHQHLEPAIRAITLGENKVCGLTRSQDAKSAYDAGAVYGGLIFAPQSPRKVSPRQAQEVQTGAPLKYVGVFQNQTLDEVNKIATSLHLSAVQLHGDENQDYIDTLKTTLPADTQIWKAISLDTQKIQNLREKEGVTPEKLFGIHADRYVLDTQVQGKSGGTGQCFDWSLLENWDKSQLMLAGGISPSNALKAANIGCLGLDINSGVESAPGIKDPQKLSSLLQSLRNYA